MTPLNYGFSAKRSSCHYEEYMMLFERLSLWMDKDDFGTSSLLSKTPTFHVSHALKPFELSCVVRLAVSSHKPPAVKPDDKKALLNHIPPKKHENPRNNNVL
ncbi:uncharacterized protein CLUP02_10090 [Colletotrichum lupini]|uniref:Uncharacterized protein n=1 Tax=Colletotrichum lupini TaxID=145971 RepID=A0A9Q8WI75_9PEZI|nr:uncharacterized protein CLUP02_10090 [Colletotrichum lupini]UQC84593.1 hypothetical protein CLUP02_10090 [Colletotrichum lupini]